MATYKRPATNAETIADLMQWAKSGPIVQLFIMDALSKHAERVAKLTDEEVAAAFPPDSFIHGPSWRDAAREIKSTLDAHFAGTRLVDVKDEDDDEDF